MSKSLGNTVDIAKLRKFAGLYGQDALRYYVLRAAPFGSDLDWSDAEFVKTYTGTRQHRRQLAESRIEYDHSIPQRSAAGSRGG